MQYFLSRAFLALLLFAPKVSDAQNLEQLMDAKAYQEMISGPDRIRQVRELEHKGWLHHDEQMDHIGNLIETKKFDLSPFVDQLGASFFLVTDISPEFPGGSTSFKDYQQNLLGDLLARSTDEVQNTLFIKFSVLKDGKIDAVEPASPFPDWIPASTIQRCMAAIRDMPVWSPGIFNGEPVNVKLLVDFSLRK
jgi:hypothetical protein